MALDNYMEFWSFFISLYFCKFFHSGAIFRICAQHIAEIGAGVVIEASPLHAELNIRIDPEGLSLSR